MKTIDRYSEYLTTYDQILDAASLLTSLIEHYREGRNDGMIKPEVAKSWIRFYNKALIRYLEFMSSLEIRISKIKGSKSIFIYPDEHKTIPYYTVSIRRRIGVSNNPRVSNNKNGENLITSNSILFDYYDKHMLYSDRTGDKPTLYEILDYIKRTFYVPDIDNCHSDMWRSLDQMKRECPENKETYETMEKLQSIFSDTDMLRIPITLGCPFYDDYYEEIWKLEEIEKADPDSAETLTLE
jgi:hypothetical protein